MEYFYLYLYDVYIYAIVNYYVIKKEYVNRELVPVPIKSIQISLTIITTLIPLDRFIAKSRGICGIWMLPVLKSVIHFGKGKQSCSRLDKRQPPRIFMNILNLWSHHHSDNKVHIFILLKNGN